MNEITITLCAPEDAMVVREGMKQVLMSDGFGEKAKETAFYIALQAQNILHDMYNHMYDKENTNDTI